MDYYNCVMRSIDYIEQHLSDKITLPDISTKAGISISHLYRIFPAFAGCTIGQYIRRRRLTEAARSLHQENRVLDVAVGYQFESQESFTRAFKSLFGITPGEYKRSAVLIPGYPPIRIIPGKKGDSLMQPDILIKRFALTGLEARVDLNADFTGLITELTEKLRRKLKAMNSLAEPVRIINMWYPKFENDMPTSEPATMFFTGAEVIDAGHRFSGMTVKTFPESMYAVFEEARRGTIGGPDGYAYKTWLPSSGYVLNENIPGDFEVYGDTEHTGYEDNCSIWIPVCR